MFFFFHRDCRLDENNLLSEIMTDPGPVHTGLEEYGRTKLAFATRRFDCRTWTEFREHPFFLKVAGYYGKRI